MTDEKIEYRFVTNRLFSRIVNHRFSINFRFSSSTPFELTLSVFSSALISCEHRGGNVISDSCCQEEGVKNKKREGGRKGITAIHGVKGKGDEKKLHGTRNVCKRLPSKVRHFTSRATLRRRRRNEFYKHIRPRVQNPLHLR